MIDATTPPPTGRTGRTGRTGQGVRLPELDGSALLELAREAFVAVDPAGVIVGWNRAAAEMFGWSAAEASGRRIADLIGVDRSGAGSPLGPLGPPEASESAAASVERPAVRRRKARHRDGHAFPVEVVARALPSPAGPVVCGFLVDMSRRISAEQAAEEQHLFLSAVLDNLLAMVAALDQNGNVVVLNRACREFYRLDEDWTPEDLVPLWAGVSRLDGTQMPLEEMPIIRAMQGETVRGVEMLTRAPGIQERVFSVNAQAITGGDGRPLGAVSVLHDITDRQRAERFRTCELQVVKALTYARDVAGAGREVLPAIASTLGWPYAELWLVDDLFMVLRQVATWPTEGAEPEGGARGGAVPRRPAPERLSRGEGLAGVVWDRDEPLWVPDLAGAGDPALAETVARYGPRPALGLPIQGDDTVQGVLLLVAEGAERPPEHVMALLSAMTAHIGAYLARQHARDLAAKLDRAREDFLSLAGHALRTPLTSIASYTDLLLSQSAHLSEQDRHMLTVVSRHTESLRGVIDDLLEVAGFQSGHVVVEPHRTDLVPLLRAALADTERLARENHVDFTTVTPDALPVVADPAQLRRVMDNLLANAVKYSPEGGTVQVRLADSADSVLLTIADCGVGVPPDEQDRLFQRFFRASNVLNRGIGGSGLGLTVAQAIVTAHGGQITLADRPDRETGTVVTVRLPAHRSDG